MQKVSYEQAYQQMRSMLNEKQWRQYLAVEAQQRGSTSMVAREAGVSLNTVKRGLAELEAGESYQPGERIRKVGGGKKKVVETDATLLADLEQEVEPKGDPMSLLRWTCKSLDHLVKALWAKGHHIKKSALAEVLHAQGFSLHENREDHRGESACGSRRPVCPYQPHLPRVRTARCPDHLGRLQEEGTAGQC